MYTLSMVISHFWSFSSVSCHESESKVADDVNKQTIDHSFSCNLAPMMLKLDKIEIGKTGNTEVWCYLSHLMRLWYFLSSINSFFKHACTAIQWG